MLKVRYIADGVLVDVENLLSDFIKENSVEFSVFSSVWKKHNFSLIFMGRQGHKELLDFTHELFRLSSQFLTSSSYLYQVGGIFLLYALYRNQLLNPPVKIRILSSQWEEVAKILEEARVKKYMTLHYVIDYLIENSFDFVACETLMGPRITCMKQAPKKPDKVSKFIAGLKSNVIEFQQSNVLQEFKDLYVNYLDAKNAVPNMNECAPPTSERFQKVESFMNILNELLKDNICVSPESKSHLMSESKVTEENIGSRRAQIKASSFSRRMSYRNIDFASEPDPDSPDPEEPRAEKIKILRKKRLPKEKRRIGRPRKHRLEETKEEESADEIDEVLDLSGVLGEEKYFLPECKIPTIDATTKRQVKKREKPLKRRYYYDEKFESKKKAKLC